MSKCVPAQRDQLRALAENLSVLPSVLDLDLVTDDPTYGVVLDVTFSCEYDGLPPRACQLVGEYKGTVVDVRPQGGHPTAWVVA
jgi:hypothetical protein